MRWYHQLWCITGELLFPLRCAEASADISMARVVSPDALTDIHTGSPLRYSDSGKKKPVGTLPHPHLYCRERKEKNCKTFPNQFPVFGSSTIESKSNTLSKLRSSKVASSIATSAEVEVPCAAASWANEVFGVGAKESVVQVCC